MRIRYKTWYWGKFEVVKEMPTGQDAGDWEIYVEDKHGWHHSKEARSCKESKV
jgi:hypothetical protein